MRLAPTRGSDGHERHGGTKRLGFDARREAPVTQWQSVGHESKRRGTDSCPTVCRRVLGLLPQAHAPNPIGVYSACAASSATGSVTR